MNRLFLGLAKKDLPKVRWTGDEGQWVVDGQIWTSGGAVAGMDMMASWVIQEFGIDVAMFGFEVCFRDISLFLFRKHFMCYADPNRHLTLNHEIKTETRT